MRLFPNPDFDEAAASAWDPERFYTDKDYYTNPKLVRPYRVGMSCGFCHVGPSPIHPPADPAHPTWADLNSTVGAQYLWMDRILVYAADESNFLYQLVHSYPPGTMDTSLVSTDYINNPRTMNAVYNLGVRLGISKKWGKETLAGGELNNAQLDGFFDKPSTSWTPRVLKDGSDAVGVLGALNRVYINIGLYSEEWTRHFNAMYGGKVISPILIATAQENSAYWRATVAGTGNMAKFLVKAGRPDKLEAAPSGKQYLNADAAQLDQGKKVFAETCARCHSSKLPDEAWTMLDPGGCSGPNYLTCWKKYWQYTQKDDFKAKMREIVAKPDFLENNYLSTDARVPATLLRTNACSPLATNAIRDNIWDNFSSSTYKDLPSVGTITVQDPFTGDRRPFVMPGGGRGYTRVPSLISIWSTAPFFVNNRLGPFTTDPSVDARMKVFNASIEQLLWPERRDHEEGFDGVIVRTTQRSSIIIPKRAVPVEAESLVDGLSSEPFSRLFDKPGAYVLGPIPKGMPINILSNFQPLADLKTVDGQLEHAKNVADLGASFVLNLPPPEPDDSDAKILSWVGRLSSPLGKLNKCPDFVVNRGHYFGTGKFNETEGLTDDEKSWGVEPVLTQADKKALIEFIKTF